MALMAPDSTAPTAQYTRSCRRCGRPIRPSESFRVTCAGPGALYEHAVCPISAALAGLPPLRGPREELADALTGPEPAWVTISEAAALLRVSRSTIRLRIRSGLLPAKRLLGGQTILIARADLLALLQDARPPPDPPPDPAPLSPLDTPLSRPKASENPFPHLKRFR